MTPESVDELAALQRQILDTVHTYVKPNGVLVYSTCTIDEAENDEQCGGVVKASGVELIELAEARNEQILPVSMEVTDSLLQDL